jgi:hypothetical protein
MDFKLLISIETVLEISNFATNCEQIDLLQNGNPDLQGGVRVRFASSLLHTQRVLPVKALDSPPDENVGP